MKLIFIAKTSSALRSKRGSVRRASTTDVGISEGKIKRLAELARI